MSLSIKLLEDRRKIILPIKGLGASSNLRNFDTNILTQAEENDLITFDANGKPTLTQEPKAKTVQILNSAGTAVIGYLQDNGDGVVILWGDSTSVYIDGVSLTVFCQAILSGNVTFTGTTVSFNPSGSVRVLNNKELRFYNAAGSRYGALKAPTTYGSPEADYTLTLPTAKPTRKKPIVSETDGTLSFEDEFQARSPVVTESTTSRTLALTDAEKIIRCTNSSAVAVSIPLNSSVAYPTNTRIEILQAQGAGTVTVTGVSGVTVNGTDGGSKATTGNVTAVTLLKVATDTWEIY